MAENLVKYQIIKLIVVCFFGLMLGFGMVRLIHWHIETSPDSACGALKTSFKNNDSFDVRKCSLKGTDHGSTIQLFLQVKEEMEQYFELQMENITNENITDNQIDFYCIEFFDRTRVDELDLSIVGKSGTLQKIDITREICQ